MMARKLRYVCERCRRPVSFNGAAPMMARKHPWKLVIPSVTDSASMEPRQ